MRLAAAWELRGGGGPGSRSGGGDGGGGGGGGGIDASMFGGVLGGAFAAQQRQQQQQQAHHQMQMQQQMQQMAAAPPGFGVGGGGVMGPGPGLALGGFAPRGPSDGSGGNPNGFGLLNLSSGDVRPPPGGGMQFAGMPSLFGGANPNSGGTNQDSVDELFARMNVASPPRDPPRDHPRGTKPSSESAHTASTHGSPSVWLGAVVV